MKRKLFSAALSAFAMLLLMGAADASPQAATLVAEEESTVLMNTVLETEAQSFGRQFSQAALAAISAEPYAAGSGYLPTVVGEPHQLDSFVLTGDNQIQGGMMPADPGASGGVQWAEQQSVGGYVSLAAYAQAVFPGASVYGDGWSVSITAAGTTVTAVTGQLYLEANGRYLYIPEGVQSIGGQVCVPDTVAAKAFSGLQSGSSFYNQNDLFWLARVIYRESGNQSLEGQMAVGNVILNRVADPSFPNTVEDVLAQKNQFSTYKSGALRATNPSETSIIAAKLVLDGGVVEETRGATFFDSGTNSWAARNKQFIATFGGHNFYG